MQNAKFLILTGHLKEYPLSDVFGILRHQRKTGRLLIDYPAAPCAFFFKDGELVDARMGAMEGLQAILLATNMPDSPFNFNPLIQPTEHSVNNSLRKLALGMIGGSLDDGVVLNSKAERKAAERKAPATESVNANEAVSDVPHFQRRVLPGESTPPPPAPVVGNSDRMSTRNRVLISAGAMLLVCVIAPVVALTDVFGGKPAPPPAAGRSVPDEAEGEAPAPAESTLGAHGLSELTHGDIQPTGVVPPREKARQPPRAPAPKKSGATLDVSAEPLPSSAVPDKKAAPPPAKEAAPAGDPTITVVTRVEDGRVVEAYVANRRPGMEAFEASALRAARRRQFPSGTKGSEKVQIKVGKH